MFKLPVSLLLLVSQIMIGMAKVFGTTPFITPSLVKKFNYQWHVSSEKAKRDLGYAPRTFEQGAQQTLDFFYNQGELN